MSAGEQVGPFKVGDDRKSLGTTGLNTGQLEEEESPKAQSSVWMGLYHRISWSSSLVGCLWHGSTGASTLPEWDTLRSCRQVPGTNSCCRRQCKGRGPVRWHKRPSPKRWDVGHSWHATVHTSGGEMASLFFSTDKRCVMCLSFILCGKYWEIM